MKYVRWLVAMGWTAGGALASAQIASPVWVEMTATGASVRAIVAEGASCPVVKAGAHEVRLRERKTPGPVDAAFPVKACAANVPGGVTEVTYLHRRLRVLAGREPEARRIVVIGDTGCRRSERDLQDCEKDWPFPQIASFAAAKKPDLVIHVGDYYYRENCPGGEKHCESWENWRKDFFAPAAPLMAAAPWILARGNHEVCGRASEGWFRFLDAGVEPLACESRGPTLEAAPYAVRLKGLTLAVIDSANTVDADPVDKKMIGIAAQLAKVDLGTVSNERKPAVWVVTHKPPYEGGLAGKEAPAATGGEPPLDAVDMFVVGHIHMFGAIDFADARPAELIVGDSGTKLLPLMEKMDRLMSAADPQSMVQGELDVDGKAAHFTAKGRFGYMLLEHKTADVARWHGTLYGTSDEVLSTCEVQGRSLQCVPPKGTKAGPS